MYDLLIIGGGPAGLSAAMTARNRNLTVCVICGGAADSALYKAGHVTNYPGVPDVSGPALLETMTQQARDLGADMLRERALSAMPMGKTFGVSAGKEFVEGRALLLATGIAQRGTFPGETAFLGRGVSYCATCDGMLYRGKTVVVNGGGNTAVGDALYLAKLCKKVYLVHRRDELRASAVYRDALRENGVEILWNSRITALRKEKRLTGVEVEDLRTGARRELFCDGLFVAIGRVPDTALFAGQVELDPSGYIVADETTRTSVPGVFAVGDARTKAVRQIVTAVADGAVAAHYAEEFLLEDAVKDKNLS